MGATPVSLEQCLRDASVNGLRLHVWPCAGGYQANAAEPGVNAWTCHTAADPIEAVTSVLRKRAARVPDREVGPLAEPHQVDIEEAIAVATASRGDCSHGVPGHLRCGACDPDGGFDPDGFCVVCEGGGCDACLKTVDEFEGLL